LQENKPTNSIMAQSLDDLAISAADSVEKSDNLIRLFKPFIASCVRKFTYENDIHKFDDMNSIAMSAFYEAIKSYDKSKGHFLAFANLIINRRLTDELRKNYRLVKKQVVTDFEDEELQVANNTASLEEYKQTSHQENLRLEIEQLEAELAQWDITIQQLVQQSPKHRSLKQEIRRVVDAVLTEKEIIDILFNKNYLPVKKLSEITKTPLKKIENARKYIIAVVLIKKGDYQYLSDYIK